MVWLVIVPSVLFLLAGSALAYVFGAAAVLSFIAVDKIQFLAILPQRIFSQLDVFALMAVVIIFCHLVAKLVASATGRLPDQD